MLNLIDDARINGLRPLISPAILLEDLAPSQGYESVEQKRRKIASVLSGEDPRRLAVVGPCSIHTRMRAANTLRSFTNLLKPMVKTFWSSCDVILRNPAHPKTSKIGSAI